MVGSVIQATGTTEFEDGQSIVNYPEAWNSLQRERTTPEDKGIIVLSGGLDQVRQGLN